MQSMWCNIRLRETNVSMIDTSANADFQTCSSGQRWAVAPGDLNNLVAPYTCTHTCLGPAKDSKLVRKLVTLNKIPALAVYDTLEAKHSLTHVVKCVWFTCVKLLSFSAFKESLQKMMSLPETAIEELSFFNRTC